MPFINKKEESSNDVSACKKVYVFRAKPSTKTSYFRGTNTSNFN